MACVTRSTFGTTGKRKGGASIRSHANAVSVLTVGFEGPKNCILVFVSRAVAFGREGCGGLVTGKRLDRTEIIAR